ncbi:response regulator [Mucilaginibacter terrenus]|uniref:Response regulator n=1 Tax=Mucilaginibacter terrenus TaxID=2482727 RepID=A0A3E2NXU1_9SPHI|nr:response regulator [Mucilaginibacter terrenus]RFZ85834.1 response regulator [Mucilaginibacter terrenus]
MAKRILIIDDDEDILEILNIVFQDEGYDVVVSNTSEAADHISVIHPDIVLLDVRIKGSTKNGLQICAEIKSLYPDLKLPVILVSGEHDLASLAKQCGADGFIPKPFDIFKMTMQVNKHLM